MGFGLPIAIGAAFGSDRKVVCVDADGGVMLNLQELATLSRYAPKGFILFILNNDGYESIRVRPRLEHFGAVYGADESGVFIPAFAGPRPGLRPALRPVSRPWMSWTLFSPPMMTQHRRSSPN